ncbi:Uncharacterised protein [Klebsiella pneumoniae]|nr:Uncharacterised protein [Klebsiella pneumoniae]VAP38366.1 Uncharacterised protein [Klebsiella pneumoniae]
MLLTGGLLWLGHTILIDHLQQKALMASVAQMPAPLPEEALLILHKNSPLWLKENTHWIKQTQQQLEQLTRTDAGKSSVWASVSQKPKRSGWPSC